MQVLSELEEYKRGIYSGALGYFGLDGYVDLSVVIRTLILKDGKWNFRPAEQSQPTLIQNWSMRRRS